MPYTSRYDGQELTAEERDEQAALSEYIIDGATQADWVPTVMLYRTYRHWHAQHRWHVEPDDPERLTYRQLGRAVRRLFPAAERCRHSYHGRQQWGYCRIVGPESMRSRRLAPDSDLW